MAFDLSAYLDRLSLPEPGTGREGLARLHFAHMSHIPFENTAPLLERIPSLEPAALMDKLVRRRRGGYCFEHNGLYGLALAELGHTARPLLARVRNGAPVGGARTHQAWLVEIDGETWMSDVGFGGHAPLAPIPYRTGEAFEVPNGRYRFVTDPTTGETVLERLSGTDWTSLWGYDGVPVPQIDIEAANIVTACWDKAPFRANLMAAFHGPRGRVTLFNRAFSRGLPPDLETRLLEDAGDLARVLSIDFTLDLDDGDISAIWDKIKGAPVGR
ncbi:arylamine N-acetyltransferase [Maritimibacter sp. UBA3975]|uniref:arylamine N-acetyltransferase family protein n=1 Tax=Maritimibacter sp. UBA3975 TaxID=1946833 RepID=UPI000C0A6522|nr:arylamine N-acetyltransferase [Maritimibacter sp. UBA3975]MAM60888.1 arylamine N-acetyltransferase [Maritimibacter sp.]|tara:strand:+ start:3296 stop:4111 length:816 start_codon:yes stop_codon:yes gene_type:complete